MPKQKTCKSAAKRFRKSSRGKILFRKAGGSHLMGSKSSKRRRQFRKPGVLSTAEVKRVSLRLAK